MKKLMFLFIAGTMFVFSACNCGTGDAAATDAVEEVACADDCQKACCLGCKATVGDKVCLANHTCCTVDHDADIEYQEGYGEESHEGHNHGEESHEGHNHGEESHEGHNHE
jgi:hypothetical protein